MRHGCICKYWTVFAFLLLKGTLSITGQTGLKIMPLGNSVTRGSMCTNGDIYTCVRIDDDQAIGYRHKLYNLLNNAGYSFDFVGSQQYGSAIMSDPDNAGFSGIRDEKLADLMQTGTSTHTGKVTPGAYMNSFPADIILLHIGTNDVLAGDYNSDGVARILDAVKSYESSSGKPVLVFLAKIISRADYACNTHSGTVTYNNNLVTMAQSRINNGDHIVLVDMECGAGLNYYNDLADQVHPNQTGYNKMADKWFAALHGYNNAPVVTRIPDQSVDQYESFATITLDSYVTDAEDNPQNISWTFLPESPEHLSITIEANRIAHISVKNSAWSGAESIEFVATDRGKVLTQLKKSSSTTVTFTVNKLNSPIAPGNLSAAALSTNTVGLSWQDNADNEDGYDIYRSETPGTGFVLISTVLSDVIAWQDTGLMENTNYYYRVRAFNKGGTSLYSNEAAVTTLLGLPDAPDGLTAVTDSNGSVALDWNDNAANEDGFEIERYESEEDSFLLVCTVAANITAYIDTGLTENKTYMYRIRAYNAAGVSQFSGTAEITVPYRIPDSPFNLREVMTTHQSVILAWDNKSPDVNSFEIRYSISEGGPFNYVQIIETPEMLYVINGLEPDTYYYFSIRALKDTLKSSFSNTILVNTLVNPVLSVDNSDIKNGYSKGIDLLVYPNPLKEKAVLSYSAPAGEGSLIKIYDLQGRLLMTDQGPFYDSRENILWEMDVSILKPGIYMLVVSTRDQTVTKRIVIERR